MKIALILLFIVGCTVSQAVNVQQDNHRGRNDVFSTNPTLLESTTDKSAVKGTHFSQINSQSGRNDAIRGDNLQKSFLTQGLNSARSDLFRQSGIKSRQNLFRSEQMRPLFPTMLEQRAFNRFPEPQQMYGQEQSLSEQQQFFGDRQDEDKQQLRLFRNRQDNIDRRQFTDSNRQAEFGHSQMFSSNDNILDQQQQYYSDRQDMLEQPRRLENSQERFRQQRVFERRQDILGQPQQFSNNQEREQPQAFGNRQDNLEQLQHFRNRDERMRQQQIYGKNQDQLGQQQFFENQKDKVEQLRRFNERQANKNLQQFIVENQTSHPNYANDAMNQNQRTNNILFSKSKTNFLSGKGIAISTEPQTQQSLRTELNKNQPTGQAQGITLQSSFAVSGINNPPLLPTLSGQSGLMPSVYSVGVSKGTAFKAANMDQSVQTPYARYAFRHLL